MKKLFQVAVLVLIVSAAFAQQPAPPAPPFEYPVRFEANYMAMGGPGPTMAGRVVLTLERASTKDERGALLRTLKEKGQDALISAMEKAEVGRIQIDSRLSWPVRVASVFSTEKGWVIRAATDRRMGFEEVSQNTRSADYPVGILELQLPPGGGEAIGALFAATRMGFDENGRLSVESLPSNTGPTKLTNISFETVKAKKKKGE